MLFRSRLAKPRDLLGVQDDEDRLAGLNPVADELEHSTQKLVRAPVEEGLVDEGWILVADRNSHSAQSYASKVPRLSELKLRPGVAREQEAVVLLVAALQAALLGNAREAVASPRASVLEDGCGLDIGRVAGAARL